MPRPTLALPVLLVTLLLPAGAIAARSPAFALGTYTGTVDGGGKAKIRLSRGECYRARQNATLVRGTCMAVLRLDAPRAACADGRTEPANLWAYVTDDEVIRIKPSGRYRDRMETYAANGKEPIAVTTLAIDARGSRITGSIRTTATNYYGAACDSGTHRFRLRR
jgi:hypothetical protein